MDQDKWLDFYRSDRKNRSKVFVKVMTSDREHFFFTEDQYDTWYKIKKHCETKSVFIKDLQLQARSNVQDIDLEGSDGIYLVRSVLGQIGADTRKFFTIGKLKNKTVNKQMWLVPELIIDKEYEDTLSGCFEEALITYDKKTKNRKK